MAELLHVSTTINTKNNRNETVRTSDIELQQKHRTINNE